MERKMRKGAKILEYLNQTPRLSDKEIAKRTKSSPAYVQHLRRKMVHVEETVPVYDEAAEITGANDSISQVLDERATRYGRFEVVSSVTQGLKGLVARYLEDNRKVLAPDQQEALDMIFSKIGRIISGDADYDDNWTDIAGYAKLVSDRLQGNVR